MDKVLDQVDNSSITNILMNMIKSDIQNTYNDLTIDQVLEFNEKNGYKIYFEGAAELESTVEPTLKKLLTNSLTMIAYSDQVACSKIWIATALRRYVLSL